MSFLPVVVRAEHRGAFRIYLTFNDGSTGVVDFSRWLQGPAFAPLRDPAYFAQFTVDGETVAWPNGADVAPETLYDEVRAPSAAGRAC